jgi:predicted SprT family Zn-dependent metalloprotease
MDLQKAETLASNLINAYLGPTWTFKWNNRHRCFGVCSHTSRTIQLSRRLTPAEDDFAIEQTILHEIAHALTPGAGHGAEWRRVARKIGVKNPKSSREATGDSIDTNPPKFVTVLGKEIIWKHYRRPNAKTMGTIHIAYVANRKEETLGKLRIISYSDHLVERSVIVDDHVKKTTKKRQPVYVRVYDIGTKYPHSRKCKTRTDASKFVESICGEGSCPYNSAAKRLFDTGKIDINTSNGYYRVTIES